ncbi:MAG: helicase C-terminal domain-containing protein [Candidatus Thorarchaeota archaeon]
MINAETGSGKTAAVFSAILSRKEPNERVIIFTKMLGQMDAWFRELGLINDYNRQMGNKIYSMIPLVGKNHICPMVNKETRKQFAQIGCALFECKYQQSFHIMQSKIGDNESYSNNVLTEIEDSIKKEVGLSEILWILENKIENFGCPYLAIKKALEKAEISITTYPFIIDPKLFAIFAENVDLDLSNFTIVIDEAHNLAKGLFDEMSYKILDRAKIEMGTHPLLDELFSLKDQSGLHELDFEPSLLEDLENRGRQYLLWKFDNGYRDISYTLRVCEFLKNAHFCYITAEKKFSLYLKDPRNILKPIKKAKQLILISGTFRPLKDFADFLGVPEAHKISINSETQNTNRIILTTSNPELTMKYQLRSRDLFMKYGHEIGNIFPSIPGHLLVFTPNYEISLILSNILNTDYFERPNQSITRLITEVKNSKEKQIIIAPARGKVSEGIEFVKDDKSLISAVVIAGLPYPPPSKSLREIITAYSEFWGEEKANNYMSYLQATVTMRQCLGRMIRSENDVGAWIILDNRINNMDIFPRAITCKDTEQMIERLNFFYTQHTNDQ